MNTLHITITLKGYLALPLKFIDKKCYMVGEKDALHITKCNRGILLRFFNSNWDACICHYTFQNESKTTGFMSTVYTVFSTYAVPYTDHCRVDIFSISAVLHSTKARQD